MMSNKLNSVVDFDRLSRSVYCEKIKENTFFGCNEFSSSIALPNIVSWKIKWFHATKMKWQSLNRCRIIAFVSNIFFCFFTHQLYQLIWIFSCYSEKAIGSCCSVECRANQYPFVWTVYIAVASIGLSLASRCRQIICTRTGILDSWYFIQCCQKAWTNRYW